MTRIDRRHALKVLGASALLAACRTETETRPSAATTTTPDSSGSATRAPSETGGPFPADGTNGPNVLDDSGVVRRDITTSYGEFSGTAAGVPLTVNLKVMKAGTDLADGGAALYLWHCDADGLYSLYSQGATDQNYCRGVQVADSSGALSFKTVFPGCYGGRWPHFHYEVFPSLRAASSASSRALTSQIALPEDACDEVYADSSGYPNSANNLGRLSLESDGVFRDSFQAQMGAVTGSPSGYTMTYTVVV